MKKIGVILILLLALTIPFIAAQETDDERITKAYSCLEGKVKDKCSQLTGEEQSFSLLALAYNSGTAGECKSALMSNSKNNECWPKSACKLRETSLAALSLQRIISNTAKTENWLLNQTKIPSDLSWYLEIDAKEPSTCKIYLDNSSSVSNTIVQDSGKKLSLSGSGSCLALANSNYWLQISQSCINRIFKVSCDKDFVTALIYKKLNSDIWHVSSKTESASASGTTENHPLAYCFMQNNECDYEGSLWAVLALQKNHETENFLPYLIALAPDNEKYNPYSFLYILTGSDEYLASIHASQNPAGFWDLSNYGKFYDTPLSLLALRDLEDESADKSKSWLLSVQGDNGCWQNSVKDTAFVLYSAWQKEAVSIPDGADIDYCEDYKFYCSSRTECIDAEGEILSNYACRDSLKTCCSKQIAEKTCSEKQGIKCSSDEECLGDLVSASDSGKCCTNGKCEKIEVSECENSGFSCRNSCLSDEESKTLSCSSDKICCGTKEETSSYWWLWLLIILIILVVLGIIFRRRLQVFIFRLKNRFTKGKGSSVQQTRPPFPPSRPMMRPVFPQRPVQRQVQKTKSKTDVELDETLRKLKEMSK